MNKFITLSFFFLSISLSSPTANGDVSFDLRKASKTTYSSFMTQLRAALPTKGMTVCNIPLLPSTATGLQWFTFFNLTNYNDKTVTVAVNVTNVYIVAYRAGAKSYFFEDTSVEASRLLFEGTTKVNLPFSGNYDKLQSVVGKSRDLIELGIPALSSAVTNMFYYDKKLTATALLVLIQSTAEAARFTYIEQEISRGISSNFYPNGALISLENNWGALSKQIQIANRTGDGQFKTPVVLVSPNGTQFSVSSTSSKVVKGNIKLLLYNKVNVANENEIVTTLDSGAVGMLDNMNGPRNGNYVTM